MSMKPPILTAATLVAVFAGPLAAVDSTLLNLVMPDAKVLAGVNVQQAEGTLFGQFMLTQIQTQGAAQLQQFVAMTGFDPTRDVSELLFATNGVPQTGLALARGTFNPQAIQSSAQASGCTTETYQGLTLLEDPKQTHAVAFLNSTYAVAGDIASVKAAIDRQSAPAPLAAAVILQANQWSGAQDAWVLTTVPPGSLNPAGNAPSAPNPALQSALQNIQQAAGGVKFGAQIVVTGQAQADTAQNATALASAAQFLISLAQTQQKNAQLAAILPSLSVAASGNLVNVSLSVPEAQAEQAVQSKPGAAPQNERRGPARGTRRL